MALALLSKRWAHTQGGCISALIVDHGLRPESADEAQQTQKRLAQHQIESHILSLDLTHGKAIQERARDARYAILRAWCREQEVLHLLTAHHQCDQAETLLFRLTRHSGMRGLACMPLVREQQGVRLIRPLLATPKNALEDYLKACNQPWVHDPSNDQTRFTRIQFRKMLASMPDDFSARIAALAERFGNWRRHDDQQLNHALCRLLTLTEIGTLKVSFSITELPRCLQQAIWQAVLTSLSSQSTPPRTAALERLMQRLESVSRDSLHGCDIVANRQHACWMITPRLEETLPATYIGLAPKPLADAPFSAMNRNMQ